MDIKTAFEVALALNKMTKYQYAEQAGCSPSNVTVTLDRGKGPLLKEIQGFITMTLNQKIPLLVSYIESNSN
jgi:hypothetical protein